MDLLQSVRDLGITAAAVIGALWALWRLWIERAFETALQIDVKTESQQLGSNTFVFIEVVLMNKAKRKLEAKRSKAGEYVYQDEEEKLKYSCSLQIRSVAESAGAAGSYLNWFKGNHLQLVSGIPEEINLLDEYENPASGETEEWLEPGESRHLGVAVALAPGEYLMKVTFIGNRYSAEALVQLNGSVFAF